MTEKDQQEKKLHLIKGLFKAREDVFALHWRKGNKSGYMPACQFDPYMYRRHKMKGGTFGNYKEKTHLPLTDQQILKHLNGEQLIGIYPLLINDHSWFIAADFDKENWLAECKGFIKICNENGIPAYLERSRSGNGGHVWVFFDKQYPAVKSRSVFTEMLQDSGVISVFDKNSSFDRLFPNQDFLSGKGFGNLIALPFYKQSYDLGNSCFIDPFTEDPHPYVDQIEFLSNVQRASTTHLDQLYDSLNSVTSVTTSIQPGRLQIILTNEIRLNKAALPSHLTNFLKEELNFSNAEFFIKKKSGKNTWGTERYFTFIEEEGNDVIIPRGFIGKLLRYCKNQQVDFDFLDKRKKRSNVDFSIDIALRPHQHKAIEVVSRKDVGIITAPPGSGKTVIGLQIMAEKKQPALIIVHRKQLMEQWIERIQSFLGIPKHEIGKIGQGKVKLGRAVTVAMVQSLGKFIEKEQSAKALAFFGCVIIDECHHIPAKSYSASIAKLAPYYQYGLTATPFRKGSDGKAIFIHLGEIISEIRPLEIEKYKEPRIIVRDTSFDVPFNPKTDQFETLSKILIHDSNRNKLILKDIITALNNGKKAVIITERKEHIDTLNQFLKQSHETITLNGEDSEKSRMVKWEMLNEGNYQALITTGQFFGEGTDLQNASCLFLVYPFSFKGKLVQYIGRVQRSEITPVIYDYRDQKVDYLNRLFLKRNRYYRQLNRQASLFDDFDRSLSTNQLTIKKRIKVPVQQLDFRYGSVAFKYTALEVGIELEFEVDNDALRPEFDVLKPYFIKAIKSKDVSIEIFAEFEDKIVVSQSAVSTDLEKINRDIIESVKFRFVEKNIFRKQYSPDTAEALLDLKHLQDEIDQSLYNTEEELMNDILKNQDVKHYRQLRFLASKHNGSILKLRFVLNPFSFVFLLSGTEQNHIVLETLDTEEATYIWHVEKNRQTLQQDLRLIDQDLNIIRNKGRQVFLKNPPGSFSRIMHDYADERKGFIIWKDMLEERLV